VVGVPGYRTEMYCVSCDVRTEFICYLEESRPRLWSSEGEGEVNLRPTVSRPVCPGVRRPSGTSDQFFFLLEISFRQLRLCYFVAPSLTRGRICNLMFNCFWALPEQQSSWLHNEDILFPVRYELNLCMLCRRKWTASVV
jgi:hypothetical protein